MRTNIEAASAARAGKRGGAVRHASGGVAQARHRIAQLLLLFVVRSGSKARVRTTTTIPRGTTALRNTLLDTGVLRQEGDILVFTSDYSFSSASAAAAAVIGASANGRILWKLPDGRTYADWEANQDNAPVVAGETGDVGEE